MSEKFSEQLYTLAEALKTTNRARGIAIARIAKKVAALERQLAAKDAEIARLRTSFRKCFAELDRLKVAYYYHLDSKVEPPDIEVIKECSKVLRESEGAALAETPAAPLTALALPEDDVPDAAPKVK